jgi:ppGpp synthetase/RelA/SpoT-type nucleotidyltranferase
MPLPVTKRQFDRLGDRLIADERPSEADLADLETALAAYQEVLEQVKVHLRDLGFAATPRVKTTTTMTDKLRRTPGMDLSRMQDIAGARITVRNLAAQDQAKDKISEFYTARGCRWREIDRRIDPRFGYRAVHLVVHVDELPVEIQIRSELQDSWAQIVERLGDRWGRGIRYGQDPENPEGIVRSGENVLTRRKLLEILMTLSDTILSVEQSRRALDSIRQVLVELDSDWQELQSLATLELLTSKVSPALDAERSASAAALTARSQELDAEARELLAIPAGNLTNAQMRRIIEINLGFVRRDSDALTERVAAQERQLRAILQVVAGATDEGA